MFVVVVSGFHLWNEGNLHLNTNSSVHQWVLKLVIQVPRERPESIVQCAMEKWRVCWFKWYGSLEAHIFKCLSWSWWNGLGGIIFVEKVCQWGGGAVDILKTQDLLSYLLPLFPLPHDFFQTCKFSALPQSYARLPHVMFPATTEMESTTFWNHEPQIKYFLL